MTTRDNCPAYLADDIDQLQHQHQAWLENRAHVAEVNALRDGHACSGCGHHVCSCARIKYSASYPVDAVVLGGGSVFDWPTALKGTMKMDLAKWRRECVASS